MVHHEGDIETPDARRGAAAAFVMPYVISSLRAGTSPSERITMGAIGLGGQGMHNLKSFLTFDDVRVLAVCDVDADHLQTAKEDGRCRLRQQGLRRVQRFSRGPRSRRPRHGADRHAGPLARDPRHRGRQGGQGHLLRKADLADDRGRPGRGRYDEAATGPSTRAARSGGASRVFASAWTSPAAACSASSRRCTATITTARRARRSRCSRSPPGSTTTGGSAPRRSSRTRPGDVTAVSAGIYDYSGGQLTDLGAHFADLAQWAHGSEDTSPTHYEGWAEFPKDGLFNTPVRFEVIATYADGVKMIMHDETEPGRGPRGNKYVGTDGWVSVDDTGKVTASSDAILRKLSATQQGYEYMEGHHRDFLELRPDAGPDHRPARGGPPLDDDLSRRQHLPASGPQAPMGPGDGATSSTTPKPTACWPAPCAAPGGCSLAPA